MEHSLIARYPTRENCRPGDTPTQVGLDSISLCTQDEAGQTLVRQEGWRQSGGPGPAPATAGRDRQWRLRTGVESSSALQASCVPWHLFQGSFLWENTHLNLCVHHTASVPLPLRTQDLSSSKATALCPLDSGSCPSLASQPPSQPPLL